MKCIEVKLCQHVHFSVSMTNTMKNGLGHPSLFTSQTCKLYRCKKVTLRMHVHFSISMTTTHQNWHQALFYRTTSSLLKLANYTVHERETDFSLSMSDIDMIKNCLGHFSLFPSPFNTCILHAASSLTLKTYT